MRLNAARGASTDGTAWAGIRTILVPPDIVAVQRRSPVPVRKRTPCRPHQDGEAVTQRAGAREWFSDRLFCEAQEGHRGSGYGTSITVHVCCAIVLILFLLTRPVPALRVNSRSSMIMPATLSMVPIPDAPWPATRSVERTAPRHELQPSAAPPPARSATDRSRPACATTPGTHAGDGRRKRDGRNRGWCRRRCPRRRRRRRPWRDHRTERGLPWPAASRRRHPAAAKAERREARVPAKWAHRPGPRHRHHRGDDRRRRQSDQPGYPLGAVARSGGARRRPAVGCITVGPNVCGR